MARILLCVTGGIAAYKAPELVRCFVRRGHEIRVVATKAALSFVGEQALATVSGSQVRTTLWDGAAEGEVGHIELANWPDCVVIAPATAHAIARVSLGLADDLFSTIMLARTCPVFWAPAMNSVMWENPATSQHVAALRLRGHHFLGPVHGDLACGWQGEGKMLDPDAIADAVVQELSGAIRIWQGKRVLVSAGPTRVYLDPVRFLTNASTGVMGFELASACARLGAQVELLAGPVELPTPRGVARHDIETADQLFDAMRLRLESGEVDMVMMVAAVSDLRLAQSLSQKAEKEELLSQMQGLAWQKERDVLATLCGAYRPRTKFLGFAAQTVEDGDEQAVSSALLQLGRDKLARKGCDGLFVNRVGVPGVGFASPTNQGFLLFPGGTVVDLQQARDKSVLATAIVEALAQAGWGSV